MSTYGRNFDFRTTPDGPERGGRYTLDVGDQLRIGAPVIATGDTDDFGRLVVEVADGAQAPPASGLGGILVYEYAPAAYAGYDPQVTLYSDLGVTPKGAAVQVVGGATQDVKVVYRNTVDNTFLHVRQYTGVKMVDAILGGASADLSIGDFLTPQSSPDDTNGYWQKGNSDGSDGWLVVVFIDAARGEVEARLTF